MKQLLCFFLLTIIILTEVKSQQEHPNRNPKEMRARDFLDLTSESDSLTALVNMFFRKRKESKTGYIVAGGIYLVFPLIAVGGAITSSSDPTEKLQTASTIVGITVMGILAGSTVNMIRYKRSELLRIIEEYPDSQSIPDKFKSKIKPKDFPLSEFSSK